MADTARILVAEDSPTQQILVQAYLEDSGYEVELAENGRIALERVRQNRPDLVVSDLEMPEMNGLELVAAINEEFQRLPVVIITALGSEKIAAAALKAGAASYVPKEQLRSDLAPTLKRILAVGRAEDLFNERLSQCVVNTESEFSIHNDDSLVPHLIARLTREVSQLEIADENELLHIATALDEALVNAMIHGNLEVSSELRDIGDGQPYHTMVKQRKTEAPYRDRRLFVKLTASREQAVFVIRDEGPGFDPSSIPDPTDPANLEKVSGRGLLLINAFMDEVSHNDTGNEITLTKHKTA